MSEAGGTRKGRKAGELPPPLELACLNVLWRLGEARVRQVRQALEPEHKLAYTTVLTVLDRLARKGAVQRRRVARSFVYTPAVGRDELRRAAVRELVRGYFDGSTEQLLSFLRGQGPTPSAAEAALDPVLL